MWRRFLLIGSVCVNLALMALVTHLAKARFGVAEPNVGHSETFATNVPTALASPAFNSTLPVEVRPKTISFHWRQIESDDYSIYIANLRAVKCPEKTIRDILIPDLREHFDRRRSEQIDSLFTNFWISGHARAALNRERMQIERALMEEQAEVTRRLLGVEVSLEGDADFSSFPQFENFFLPYVMTASMSFDQAREFGMIVDKYRRLNIAVHLEAEKILLPEDEARLKELHARMMNELSRVMSPQDMEEFGVRIMTVSFSEQLFEGLKDSSLVLSPDEVRRMAKLYADRDDVFQKLADASFYENSLTPKERIEIEKNISAILGETRYRMYEEAIDDEFTNAKKLVESENLPAALTRTLFDIQKAARERAAEIVSDEALSWTRRKLMLQEVHSATETVCVELLGTTAMEKYSKRLSWIIEMGKQRK